MGSSIRFFAEDTPYQLRKRNLLRQWLQQVVAEHGKKLDELSIVICSDDFLLSVNQEYLNHDYFTDIITFDYGEDNSVSGDVFVSIDRVRDNAKELGLKVTDELHRVLVHGILHLLGYSDKSKAEKQEMRTKEDYCLTLREF